MLIGTLWALLAGLILGMYALPTKFVKDYEYENTWGMFFLLTMFVVPLAATYLLLNGVGEIYATMSAGKFWAVILASFFWSVGVIFWGKAIDHIGISLGFSIFIATVILVGTILPIFIEGFPALKALLMILLGIVFILLGIVCYGRAGILKEREQNAAVPTSDKKSMLTGIIIAILGGLFATGFSAANTIIRPEIIDNVRRLGNPEWMTAVAVMFPIFLTGGVVSVTFFTIQLSKKGLWKKFATPALGKNFILILIMASFHYGASVIFAYSAFRLGALGNSVGYAIFNSASVITAVVVGLMTKEWENVSSATLKWLYGAIGFMVVGIVVIAYANTI